MPDSSPDPIPSTASVPKSRDPLHGITLEKMLVQLVDCHGWENLARQIPVRCFMFDPTITSSLKFLRKTPWARQKVEALCRRMLEEKERRQS